MHLNTRKNAKEFQDWCECQPSAEIMTIIFLHHCASGDYLAEVTCKVAAYKLRFMNDPH